MLTVCYTTISLIILSIHNSTLQKHLCNLIRTAKEFLSQRDVLVGNDIAVVKQSMVSTVQHYGYTTLSGCHLVRIRGVIPPARSK